MEGALGDLVDHDFHHLLADDLLLGVLGVASGLDLSLVSTSKGDAEHAEEVAVCGLGLHEGLNQRVPLLYKGAELIAGDIKTVEVGVAVHALHFLDLELDLSPGLLVVLVLKVSKRDLENASAKRVGGDL